MPRLFVVFWCGRGFVGRRVGVRLGCRGSVVRLVLFLGTWCVPWFVVGLLFVLCLMIVKRCVHTGFLVPCWVVCAWFWGAFTGAACDTTCHSSTDCGHVGRVASRLPYVLCVACTVCVEDAVGRVRAVPPPRCSSAVAGLWDATCSGMGHVNTTVERGLRRGESILYGGFCGCFSFPCWTCGVACGLQWGVHIENNTQQSEEMDYGKQQHRFC